MANVLTDHGGPVLRNPFLVLVYWGKAWDLAVPQDAEVTKVMNRLVNTVYFKGLSQYRGIEGVRMHSSYRITTSDPPDGYTMDNVLSFVVNEVDSGSLPDFRYAPDEFIYLVFPSPTIAGQNLAEHYFRDVAASNCYAAYVNVNKQLTDLGAPVFDVLTYPASHELVETLTDPRVTGFREGGDDGEIADLCFGIPGNANGIAVNPYWSDKDDLCIYPYVALEIEIALSDDPCTTPVTAGSTDILKTRFVSVPTWIDATSFIEGLKNPIYQWKVDGNHVDALTATNQPTIQVKWHDEDVLIGVTIKDDNGFVLEGKRTFKIADPETSLFNRFRCHMRVNMKKFLTHWEPVEDNSALSFSNEDVTNFRKLSAVLDELANTIETNNR